MLFPDVLESAWQSLRVHRLRTALSVLGIVIGIASFSIMYSVGESARQQTLQAIARLGGDILTVNSQIREGLEQSALSPSLTSEDFTKLRKTCPAVRTISPEFGTQTEFLLGGKPVSVNIIGITPSFLGLNKINLQAGRLLTATEINAAQPVCLLGRELREEFFFGKDPLTQVIPIRGFLISIVGVITEEEQQAKKDIDNALLIPLALAQRIFPEKNITSFQVQAKHTEYATSELENFFQQRFGKRGLFEIQSQKLILQARQQSIRIFEYVLWAIGSISLLVGGIGIMNIMLVSVTERTREIGIRRALGATKREIKIQFLCESVLLCLFGGLGGTIIGFLGAQLIARLLQFPPVFSVQLLLLGIVIATVLGIICGTYPAARAADQDPTIVLRYE